MHTRTFKDYPPGTCVFLPWFIDQKLFGSRIRLIRLLKLVLMLFWALHSFCAWPKKTRRESGESGLSQQKSVQSAEGRSGCLRRERRSELVILVPDCRIFGAIYRPRRGEGRLQPTFDCGRDIRPGGEEPIRILQSLNDHQAAKRRR